MPESGTDPDAEHRLLIGGEWVPPGGGHYDVVNPATEQVVGRAPDASVDDALAAAAAAREAFGPWSRTAPEERAALLERAADIMDKRYEEFVPLVQAETGATLRVTKQMQVPMPSVRFRRYARGALEKLDRAVEPQVMPTTALGPGGLISGLAHRAPVGVVACITSYNFPLTNMAGKLGPALAMGNTVVVKPAPQDPLGVIKMGEVFAEAGFPPGVVNVVVGAGADASAALVESPDIDMVSFTGSTSVGQRIGEVCGRDLKRQLMELGGKGASVIFDDADLKAAIAGSGSTWAFHSGQICTAPTRVLAQRGVYEQVVAGLKQYAEALKTGDPLERDTVLGPVISELHRDRIESMVRSAVEQGAEVVTGGERPALDTGYYVAPTLLAECRIDMDSVQEEIFGPVIAVVPFDDDDEAVEMANATSYGLYDYVWSGDTARAMGVAKQLRSGNVGLNTVQRNHEMPFGGFKKSGVGRDGGTYGLHAYSELQSIVWTG